MAPERSVRAAEDIRQHYAALTGLRARQRSEGELAAMALLRRASEYAGPAGVMLTLAAAARAPHAALRKLARKLRLRD